MSKIPFLDPAWLKAGLVDTSGDAGSSGQILSSTGSGVNWVDQADITVGETDKALSLTLRVKNTESVALTKGQVVCAAPSATPPSGNVIEVKLADNNGTNSMPAIGILNEDLDAAGGTNDEGEAIMFGRISGIDTSAFSVGDEVFVSDTAGALTATKPTGVKYIQKIGVIMRDDASNGTIEIFGAGRTNDVPTPLYIDHANQRVGIGAESPSERLQISTTMSSSPTSNIFLDVDGTNTVGGGGTIIFGTSASAGTVTDYNAKIQGVRSSLDNGSSDLQFYTTHVTNDGAASVQRMVIKDSGNVGIGTDSPASILHVEGGSPTTNLIASSGNGFLRIADSATSATRKEFTILLDNANNRVDMQAIQQGVAARNITLNASGGNVGIGTIDPQEVLHVDGNILVDSVLLSNQENTDVDSAAAEMVAQVAIATYTAVFFDFVIKKGTNVRSGTVYACHDGTNVEFTETSTQDLGDTSDVTLSVDISSGNIRLVATVTSNDWSIKTLVRAI